VVFSGLLPAARGELVAGSGTPDDASHEPAPTKAAARPFEWKFTRADLARIQGLPSEPSQLGLHGDRVRQRAPAGDGSSPGRCRSLSGQAGSMVLSLFLIGVLATCLVPISYLGRPGPAEPEMQGVGSYPGDHVDGRTARRADRGSAGSCGDSAGDRQEDRYACAEGRR